MATADGDRALEAYRRAVHPLRLETLEAGGLPLPFTGARGSWIEGADGRRFLDFVGGYGTALLGHHPPRVDAALRDVLESGRPLVSPAGVSAAAGELAGKLCALAGAGLAKVYFGNSGAEGIEAALKFAMAATGRGVFLGFCEAFHGFTTGALALCGAEPWRAPFAALGVSALRAPFGDLEAVERWLESQPVAGVVVEVVQGMAGARGWPSGDLRTLAGLCRRHGTLLIVDEVLTGLGRVGEWFAFQRAAVEPDLVVVSKGLSGGAVPICAVLMTDAVYDATFRERGAVHGSTFSGNLLAVTAGLAVIEAIEGDALLERARKLSAVFEHRLGELRERGLAEVRAHGLLMSVRVGEEVRAAELWGAPALARRLLDEGVLAQVAAQAPRWLNLLPPLTLEDGELDRFCQRLERALAAPRR